MNELLLKNNYLVIKNFISSEYAKQLSDEIRNDHLKHHYKGDDQAPNSACIYNHESSLRLLHEKVDDVSLKLETPVLPTYSYTRIYSNSEELKSHTDRLACELSVTVNLDADADWPIYICDHNNEPQEVLLKPGDGAVFLGCFCPHWRHKFEGTFCTQVFLHYVRADGSASYCVGDTNRETNESKARFKVIQEYIDMGWRPPSRIQSEISIVKTPEPRYFNDLMDGIVYYENVFSKESCNEIISHFKNSVMWAPALTSGDMMDGNNISKSRKCEMLEISSEKNNPNSKKIDDKLFNLFNNYLNDYVSRYKHLIIENDSGYSLLRYNPGGEYIEHVDHGTTNNRSLTAILGLNDEYEGGELHFWGGRYKIRVGAGSIIFFPSAFIYPHRVCPVKSGIRYSIVTWFV